MLRSILVASLVLGAGCAHTPARVADPAGAERLRSIKPSNPANASLFIYRNTAFGSVFGAVAFTGTVFLDESPVGDVQDDTYAVLEVNPGRHSIRIMGSAGGLAMQTSKLVTVAAGQVQVLQLDSQQGMTSLNMKLVQIPAPNFGEISLDCHEAFTLNLASDSAAAAKPRSANSQM